jgi:CPA2 family monovalent cation:H+ antiporter-2
MHAAEHLLIVIAVAALGAALFERLRMPSVVGFLVAGAALGPGGLALVDDDESVLAIAEFGVAFLLFEIGLELPLDELRRSFRTAVLAGVIQVAVSIAAVAALCAGLGLSLETSVIVGMLVSLSSTALVMRILGQRGEVDAPHGRLALGILLLQDLAIVPYLLAIPLLAGEVPREAGPMAVAIGGAVAKLAVLAAVARFVLPWVLEWVARMRSPDLFSLFAFLIAMGSAVLAEEIGLSLAVGAFIAGLVVSASPYATQLFAEVAPLRGVLLGVFFTSVGMRLDAGQALANWQGVLVFVSGVVVFKAAVVVAIAALIFRMHMRTAVQAGLALAQTGEFSFVLAAAASAAGLLTGDLAQIFVAGSILTLIATPFLINAAPRVAVLLARSEGPPPGSGHDEVADHVVIAGYGLAGRTLAGVLRASQIPYRIVCASGQSVSQGRAKGEPIIFGDATRPAVLKHLGIERARLFCVAISDPEATRDALEVARAIAPGVHILARVRYERDIDHLVAEGANDVVSEEVESSIELVSKVLRRFDVPATAVSHFTQELRDEGYELVRGSFAGQVDPWLAEILEEVASEWVEVPETAPVRSIATLGVRKRTGASIVAVRRAGETLTNPDAAFEVRGGDSLLVLASGEQLAALRAILEDRRA